MALLREFVAWLSDYYAASTVLLLILAITRACLRQPVQRMALAWTTLLSLAVLLALSATPAWPRISFRTRNVPAPTVLRPVRDTANPTRRSGGARPLVADAAGIGVHNTGHMVQPAAPETATSPQAKSFEWPPWELGLVVTFLIGSMGIVAWEAFGIIQVRRLQSSGLPAPEFARQELGSLVPDETRRPRLLVSSHVTAAVALGIWRPTILLPPHSLEISEHPRLRSLLAHELAHLRCGDLWLLALTRVLLITQFAQPLFWWWRRQVRIDQELLADTAAAEVCGRQTYAENLVAWARLQIQSPLAGVVGIWESPGQLTRRIAMLLDERKRVQTQAPAYWYWGTGLTTLVLVTTLSLVTLRPGPPVRAAEPPAKETPPETARVPTASRVEESKPIQRSSKKKELLEISGVCTDEHHQPLANVRLYLGFADFEARTQVDLQELQSDSKGRFQFAPVDAQKLFAAMTWQQILQPPPRHLVLIGQLKGKVTYMHSIRSVRSGTPSFTVMMPPATTLKGRIVDEQNRPIVGATVSVNSLTMRRLPGVRNSITDADGRYEIADLDAWDKVASEKARREMRAPQTEDDQKDESARGYGSIRHPDFADRLFQFSIVPGTLDFTLQRPATIAGRITFQESGKPAANVNVTLDRDSSEDHAYSHDTVVTDADGRYAIQRMLVPGKYEIKANLEGWPNVVTHAFPLKSGKNVADFKLERGGTIQVKAIEISTTKPPVEYLIGSQFTLIQGMHLETKTEMHAVLNSDRTCEIPVLPGKTMLMVIDMRPTPRDGQRNRWMLVDHDRKAFQTVDVAKGETKHVELRLLRSVQLGEDSVMEHIDDEHEYADQISEFLDASKTGTPAPAATQNVVEKAAVAAIKQLGGQVKTETIERRECVVDVNMAFSEIASQPGEETRENKLFTDEGLFYLPKFPRLKTLLLMRGQATDQGLKHIRGMEHLESVCLQSAWGITDVAIAHLATLPKLKRFCTNGAEQLTDESLRHLAAVKTLEDVMIDGASFSDAGLKHLQGTKHIKNLELGSYAAVITDEGLSAFANHTELESLNLENTLITDAGLKHLHGLKNLTELELKRSAVTPAGLEALRKVLPKLKAPPPAKKGEVEHSMKRD